MIEVRSRATVTLPGGILAVTGTAASYRVPSPTNGKRVSGLSIARVLADTDGTGIGVPVLSITDRSGNLVGTFPGSSSSMGVGVSRTYTWGRVLPVIAQTTLSPSSVTAGLPCVCPLEDGDLIEIGAILSSGSLPPPPP